MPTGIDLTTTTSIQWSTQMQIDTLSMGRRGLARNVMQRRKKERSRTGVGLHGSEILMHCRALISDHARRCHSKLLNRDFIRSSETLFSCCSITARVSSNICSANSYAVPMGKTLVCNSACVASALRPPKDLRRVGVVGACAGSLTTVSAKGRGAVRCAVKATTLAPAELVL